MSDTPVRGDSRRRSTRVVLKIVILVEGVAEPLMCDGVTLVVNRHGALISAGAPLRNELKIKIQVVLTGMRANAKVVHVDPGRPEVCGIALEKPENIWDLPSPPDDWFDHARDYAGKSKDLVSTLAFLSLTISKPLQHPKSEDECKQDISTVDSPPRPGPIKWPNVRCAATRRVGHHHRCGTLLAVAVRRFVLSRELGDAVETQTTVVRLVAVACR